MSDHSALHLKYRPLTLDDVVGHEQAVSKLKGIIASGKYPSAIAFFGPSSVGKTTLARAFASTVLGKPVEDGNPDWFELNGTDNKTIEDVRNMIGISKLRPVSKIRRFVMADEAQGILSNPQAAAALLKPLEEPPKSTTWILGSMDPDKFSTNKNGVAMLNRSMQFHLKPPSEDDLKKQAGRIIKGEGFTFFTKELRDKIVEQSNKEMRTLANLIEGVAAYYNGLEDKPDKISGDAVEAAIAAASSNDDAAAVKLLIAVYAKKFGAAQRTILDIEDGFGFVRKLSYLNWFLLNDAVLKGAKHPKVWGNKSSYALKAQVATLLEAEDVTVRMRAFGFVQSAIARLQSQVQTFAIPEQMAVSTFSFDTIEALKSILKVA